MSALARVEAVWNRERAWRALFALSFVLGLGARSFIALTDHGQYWPDEVFQSLEPAHHLVYGYSLVAWEYVVGGRGVVLPALVAAVLKALSLVGLDEPTFYLPFLRGLFALVSMSAVAGAYRLARVGGASVATATVASVALSLMSLDIFFGPRAMSEVVSSSPVVWGLAFVLGAQGRTRHLVVGASLLGLAVLLRIHCGLFAVGAVGALVLQRRRRDALVVFGVLLAWAVLYGLIDLVAWGRFLHSGLYYLRFNLLEGRSAEWGVAPPAFYTKALTRSLGPHWVALATLALLGLRRAPVVVVLAGLFLVGHMAMPHKELRFIIPIFPLVCVGAAAGLEQLLRLRWWAGALATALVLVTSGASLATHRGLTERDLGRHEEGSAYDRGGPVTRLLLRASRESALCGLGLAVGGRGATYAYFALHQRVPLYEAPLPDGRFFNYLIVADGDVAGTVIATDSGHRLVRTAEGCEPDPTFEPYLDERTRALAHSPDARGPFVAR